MSDPQAKVYGEKDFINSHIQFSCLTFCPLSWKDGLVLISKCQTVILSPEEVSTSCLHLIMWLASALEFPVVIDLSYILSHFRYQFLKALFWWILHRCLYPWKLSWMFKCHNSNLSVAFQRWAILLTQQLSSCIATERGLEERLKRWED